VWNELQDKQNWLQDEIGKRDKALRKQEVIEQQMAQALEKKEQYLKELRKEQADVDSFDRFSILNMFFSLLGKIEEKREREILELAAVEAKYREIEKILIDLEKDSDQVRMELQKVEWQNLEEEMQKLKQEKKKWISENDLKAAKKLEEKNEEKTNVKAYIREIEDVLAANKDAILALEEALKSLNDAHGYSSWDTFFGGGAIVTALKHSELDASEEAIHRAQIALQRLQTELLDLHEIKADCLAVENSSFVTFADYFFDDIFSAWAVHSEIDAAIDRVEDTISKLEEMELQLMNMQLAYQRNLDEVDVEIRSILQM